MPCQTRGARVKSRVACRSGMTPAAPSPISQRTPSMTDRQLAILAALNMIAAVGAGAFGAHGLKRMLAPDLLAVWQTGVLYHLIHALGLFVVALLSARFGSASIGRGWGRERG